MSKKLFIFDLDGVLVEACDWHRDALNEALLEVSDCAITQQEHIKIFNRYERSPLQMISNKKHKDVGIKLKKIIKNTNSLFGEKLFQ